MVDKKWEDTDITHRLLMRSRKIDGYQNWTKEVLHQDLMEAHTEIERLRARLAGSEPATPATDYLNSVASN